jgi:hypothetical protein
MSRGKLQMKKLKPVSKPKRQTGRERTRLETFWGSNADRNEGQTQPQK